MPGNPGPALGFFYGPIKKPADKRVLYRIKQDITNG